MFDFRTLLIFKDILCSIFEHFCVPKCSKLEHVLILSLVCRLGLWVRCARARSVTGRQPQVRCNLLRWPHAYSLYTGGLSREGDHLAHAVVAYLPGDHP